MEVRKKIALKLKEPSGSASLTSTADQVDAQASSTDAQSSQNNLVNLAQQLSWDQPLNLMGRAIMNPLIHICEVCDHPILIYGRMKKCRHAFCRDCVKKASGECPKCHSSDQTFEEASMGSVHICTYGGGSYDNTGCGRSYLSQRDLDAHIAYRHKKTTTTAAANQPTGMQIPHPFFQPPPGGALPPAFQSQLFSQSGATWTRPSFQ